MKKSDYYLLKYDPLYWHGWCFCWCCLVYKSNKLDAAVEAKLHDALGFKKQQSKQQLHKKTLYVLNSLYYDDEPVRESYIRRCLCKWAHWALANDASMELYSISNRYLLRLLGYILKSLIFFPKLFECITLSWAQQN